MSLEINAEAGRNSIVGAKPFLEAIFDEFGELRPRWGSARRITEWTVCAAAAADTRASSAQAAAIACRRLELEGLRINSPYCLRISPSLRRLISLSGRSRARKADHRSLTGTATVGPGEVPENLTYGGVGYGSERVVSKHRQGHDVGSLRCAASSSGWEVERSPGALTDRTAR